MAGERGRHTRYVPPSFPIAFEQLFEVDALGVTPRRSVTIGALVIPGGTRLPTWVALGNIHFLDLVGRVLEVDDSGPVVLIVGYYPE